jgi:hypothetical protein
MHGHPVCARAHTAGDPLCPASSPGLVEVPVSSRDPLSAWERWTWARCRQQILGLKQRLGYGERLWVLGFELLDDGRLCDPFRNVEVFAPAQAGPPTLIPAQYSAVPEMYCLLSTYAGASEMPLTGQPLALTALDQVHRVELSVEDNTALLCYAGQDWAALQAVGVPFFGERLVRGDLAFVVWPLPRLPITLTLWRGEEDLPDGGILLFDRSAIHYLPGLLAELAWLTVWRLRNILDAEERWGYHRSKHNPQVQPLGDSAVWT